MFVIRELILGFHGHLPLVIISVGGTALEHTVGSTMILCRVLGTAKAILEALFPPIEGLLDYLNVGSSHALNIHRFILNGTS